MVLGVSDIKGAVIEKIEFDLPMLGGGASRSTGRLNNKGRGNWMYNPWPNHIGFMLDATFVK